MYVIMHVINSFSLMLTCWRIGISCLDHLIHKYFPMFLIPSLLCDVVKINFRFYFSNAKGRILLLGLLYITIYCGVNCCSFSYSEFLIWAFFSHEFHGFSGCFFLCSLRMCPSKFHLLLVTSIDTGFEFVFSYNLLFLIFWGHLIFS